MSRKKSPFETTNNKENSPIANNIYKTSFTNQNQLLPTNSQQSSILNQNYNGSINDWNAKTSLNNAFQSVDSLNNPSRQNRKMMQQDTIQMNSKNSVANNFKSPFLSNNNSNISLESLQGNRDSTNYLKNQLIMQNNNANIAYPNRQMQANQNNSSINHIKANLFDSSNQISSSSSNPKLNFINSNLAAATASCQAAIEAQQNYFQKQAKQKSPFVTENNTNGATRAKLLKNDSVYFNKSISPQPHTTNYDFLFNKNQKSNENGDSPEKNVILTKKNDLFNNQSQNNLNTLTNTNSIDQIDRQSSTASIVSKRAALYEQKLNEETKAQSQNQSTSASSVSSRRNSFAKSNISPNKLMSSINNVNNENLSNNPIEDVEMLSSSTSSSSSYKENKQPSMSFVEASVGEAKSLNNMNNTLQTAIDASSTSSASTNSSKEPSKLSISEKMKLFSSPNIEYTSTKIKASNKNESNRFQNQVTESFIFLYF